MGKYVVNKSITCSLYNSKYDILIVKNLPKTRSGKIIRALLKQIVNKEKIYVPPTIEDAKCLPEIIKLFEAKYKL